MNLEEGEPVGLSTGLQAGAFLGLYLGFSLAVISVLTDPTQLQRLAGLMCTPPLFGALLLGPFLARRRKPVDLGRKPLAHARELLEPYNEGQGKWRVLSHVKSDGMSIRIDMHDLSNLSGVVDAALPLADLCSLKFIVGRGVPNSRQPELRKLVLNLVEERVNITRRRRTAKSIEISPVPTVKYINQQQKINRALLILLPVFSFLAWLEMRH
ncbi:MAG: hypothetical protein DWC04_06185 [Candidatus Poseidoniales archaeon]|nr:MAG: hypothetical protein DWC04_06185 [Candidatus Poseidoniales archaeon]